MSSAILIAALLLVGPASAATTSAEEICAERIAAHPEYGFRVIHDGGTGTSLLFGTAPDGSELMLQTMPTAIPDAEPDCMPWQVGKELARTQARMVAGQIEPQDVTLHQSDLPTMTAVVVVRQAATGTVLAAGSFYTFARIQRFAALDLGMPVELLVMRGGRSDARHVDEHGVKWHDLGEHMLHAKDGLVYEVGKSVVLEGHWRSTAQDVCSVVPPVGVSTLERGEEPVVRLMMQTDVPTWGARLMRGDSFPATLHAYSYQWLPDRGIFMVKAPYELEDIPYAVQPDCGSRSR